MLPMRTPRSTLSVHSLEARTSKGRSTPVIAGKSKTQYMLGRKQYIDGCSDMLRYEDDLVKTDEGWRIKNRARIDSVSYNVP